MSIKAKIMILLKYGGSWILGAILQLALLVLIWRGLQGARRRWALGAWAVFFCAYCLIPIDSLFSLTLPAGLYRALVLPALAWQFATALALFGFGATVAWIAVARRTRCREAAAQAWGSGPVQGTLAVLFAVGLALPSAGFHQALGAPRVVRRTVPVSGLVAPVTILHVTDLHAGYFCGPAELGRVVRIARELAPDLIVLTGDQLHGAHGPFVGWLRRGLAGLTAPLGVYQVAGNHDYRTGLWLLYQALRPLGVIPLHDAHRVLATAGGPLVLAGVDDLRYGGNLADALAGRPVGVPVVLLSHRPEALPRAAAAGVDVVLAGHTHGGQVCLFGACLSDFEGPWRRGMYRFGDTVMNVSSGVGTTGLPLRWSSPPDVTLITLEPAP